MPDEQISIQESAKVVVLEEAPVASDQVGWTTHTNLKKYDEDMNLVEEIDVEGNAASIGGISALWQRLIGTGQTAFDNTNAAIGVGDSTTANPSPLNLNNLSASTNKLRKGMDSTYPQQADSTTTDSARTITFRSTFQSAEANFAWNEWGVFNNATDGSGRMLNRKVESLGTKVAGATWQLTITLTMA